MLSLTACPEPACVSPAEITDRYALWSTDGPIEHASTRCLFRHHFTLPTAMLAGERTISRAQSSAVDRAA
jgi:hypothetical protein